MTDSLTFRDFQELIGRYWDYLRKYQPKGGWGDHRDLDMALTHLASKTEDKRVVTMIKHDMSIRLLKEGVVDLRTDRVTTIRDPSGRTVRKIRYFFAKVLGWVPLHYQRISEVHQPQLPKATAMKVYVSERSKLKRG